MTIKDLEARSGLPRANIRYYESEGLLSPRRLPNGYRDYSEEDAAELDRIKLLRALRLDIETIRLVQKGTLPLEKALFNQLTRLEGEKNQAERAAAVCRELERSRVEYAALDAARWLPELEAPARSPAPLPARPKVGEDWQKDDTDYARFHPWRRYLARMADNSIYMLLIYALLGFVFRVDLIGMGALAEWAAGFVGLGAAILAEPLWLHFWGWTPGKWIFGLKVRDQSGEKLSLADAWARALGVFSRGYGWNIPIYGIYRLWKSYKCCQEGECPWDAENGVRYVHEGRRGAAAMFAASQALYLFLTVALMLQTLLPPNRGELTAAEYCGNFNFYLARAGLNERVDDAGRWREDPNEFVVNLTGTEHSDLALTLTGGCVTAVSLSDYPPPPNPAVTHSGDQWIYMQQTMYQIATLALAGAQERFNCFTFDYAGWCEFWTEDDKYDSFTEDYRGLRFVQEVEYSGFDGKFGPSLSAGEGRETSYRRDVSITLTGDD